MRELVLAAVAAAALGFIDIGIVKYRFYSVWLGKSVARAAMIGLLLLNGSAGILGWWFANLISNAPGPGSVPGPQNADISTRGWWVIRGIGFGALGYAVLRAQIPRFTDRAGDAVSILGKVQSLIIDYLDSTAERKIRSRVQAYADDELATRLRGLLHQFVNRDASLNELQQKKMGSDLKRKIRALRVEKDPDELDDIRIQLQVTCENYIVEYQELPDREAVPAIEGTVLPD